MIDEEEVMMIYKWKEAEHEGRGESKGIQFVSLEDLITHKKVNRETDSEATLLRNYKIKE